MAAAASLQSSSSLSARAVVSSCSEVSAAACVQSRRRQGFPPDCEVAHELGSVVPVLKLPCSERTP